MPPFGIQVVTWVGRVKVGIDLTLRVHHEKQRPQTISWFNKEDPCGSSPSRHHMFMNDLCRVSIDNPYRAFVSTRTNYKL